MKSVVYLGSSKDDIEQFSITAKERIVTALTAVCAGIHLNPSEFKYMPTVGVGVYELRIKTDKQHRVFYMAKFDEAVYVLHAFIKKTRETSSKDIQLGRTRYKALMSHRLRSKK